MAEYTVEEALILEEWEREAAHEADVGLQTARADRVMQMRAELEHITKQNMLGGLLETHSEDMGETVDPQARQKKLYESFLTYAGQIGSYDFHANTDLKELALRAHFPASYMLKMSPLKVSTEFRKRKLYANRLLNPKQDQ